MNLPVRGRASKVLLALVMAAAVVAVAVYAGSDKTGTQVTGPRPAAPDGNAANVSATATAKGDSPSQTVSSAKGYLVPAIRSQPRTKARKSARPAKNELNETPLLGLRVPTPPVRDGALQTSQGKSHTPAPSLTFEGIFNMCGCYPPDTNGDVGGTQYMEWVNLHFAIYDKNTG